MDTKSIAGISLSTSSQTGAVILGVIACMIWAAIATAGYFFWRRWRGRRGHLAGWWWQITYPPRAGLEFDQRIVELVGAVANDEVGDRQEAAEISAWMSTSSNSPWSLELLKLRHGSNGKWQGRMWRIHKSHFERVWDAKGVVLADAAIEGLYLRSDSGAHGAYLMRTKELACRYVGWFYEWSLGDRGSKLETFPISAPLAWGKVGLDDNDSEALEWVDRDCIERGWPRWPRQVRRRMLAALDPLKESRNSLAATCVYFAASFGDSAVCLDYEERRRAMAADDTGAAPPQGN